MNPTLKMLITTLPKNADIDAFSKQLLKDNLCVCIQAIPAISSYYIWENIVEHDDEIQLHIKFLAQHLNKLESTIVQMHPYDTPEIIVLNIDYVNEKYQKWANSSYLEN
jgi:periplasmic divalent cation tolerance protein